MAKAGFAHSQLQWEMFTGILRKSADENTVVLEDISRHGFTAAFFFLCVAIRDGTAFQYYFSISEWFKIVSEEGTT